MKLDDLKGPECARCGASLEGKRSDAVFCSYDCFMADYADIQKAAIREAKRGRKCGHCDGEISVEKNAKAIYCSTYCQMQAYYHSERRRFPGTCKICGDEFQGHHATQIYCSPRCRAKAGLVVRAKKWKPKMICERCGTPFKARPNGRHCSRKCRGAAEKAAKEPIRNPNANL
jgi:hypothetical protein